MPLEKPETNSPVKGRRSGLAEVLEPVIRAEVLSPTTDRFLRDRPRLLGRELRVLLEPLDEVLDGGPAVLVRLAVGVLELDAAVGQADAHDPALDRDLERVEPEPADPGHGQRVRAERPRAEGQSAGFSQTDTWARLSLVKGSFVHPAQRSRSVIPASWAIRSSSEGQTYLNGIEKCSARPSWIQK
jgi:hypothetical protein